MIIDTASLAFGSLIIAIVLGIAICSKIKNCIFKW